MLFSCASAHYRRDDTMTKRSVISVVAILAAIVLAFGMAATACGHEHTFASAWETDATHHWHAATCEHADEKADLGEHVPAAPVRENEIAATCTVDGSYDEVIYCADCHYEIDREEKTIVAAHSYGEDNICKVCGHSRATEGLRFTLNGDERSYTCSGIGTAEGAEIYIPAEYDGKPVTGIREYAFDGLSALTSIAIPASVTSIGRYAFNGLTAVITWSGTPAIQTIGDSAFAGYKGKSLTVPASVTAIERFAFRDCTALTRINFDAISVADAGWTSSAFYNAGTEGEGIDIVTGESVERIPAYFLDIFFMEAPPKIKSVTIGRNVTSLGRNLFLGCGAEIVWEGTPAIRTIDDHAFSGYLGTSVTIPESVTSIGDNAFSGCVFLTEMVIPDGVTSIDDDAFSGSSSLEVVTIPESVTSIGDNAFSYCGDLKRVNYDAVAVRDLSADSDIFAGSGTTGEGIAIVTGENVEHIPAYFLSKGDAFGNVGASESEIASVTLGRNVTSIGEYAFSGLTVPITWSGTPTIRTIGARAFNGYQGTFVTVPESVTIIEIFAFENCPALTTVYYSGTARQWSDITIHPYNPALTSATLYCYSESEPSATADGDYWHYVNGTPTPWADAALHAPSR